MVALYKLFTWLVADYLLHFLPCWTTCQIRIHLTECSFSSLVCIEPATRLLSLYCHSDKKNSFENSFFCSKSCMFSDALIQREIQLLWFCCHFTHSLFQCKEGIKVKGQTVRYFKTLLQLKQATSKEMNWGQRRKLSAEGVHASACRCPQFSPHLHCSAPLHSLPSFLPFFPHQKRWKKTPLPGSASFLHLESVRRKYITTWTCFAYTNSGIYNPMKPLLVVWDLFFFFTWLSEVDI